VPSVKASAPGSRDEHRGRRDDLLRQRIGTKANSQSRQTQVDPLRAELIGSSQATAAGLSVTGHAPVLKLCRVLIDAGHDPRTPLEAYRGPTLCLRVRSIGEGAKLTVEDSAAGRPRFVRHRARTCGAAPPVAQTGEGVGQAAEHAEEAMHEAVA
jgi:hypothetical protein